MSNSQIVVDIIDNARTLGRECLFADHDGFPGADAGETVEVTLQDASWIVVGMMLLNHLANLATMRF